MQESLAFSVFVSVGKIIIDRTTTPAFSHRQPIMLCLLMLQIKILGSSY